MLKRPVHPGAVLKDELADYETGEAIRHLPTKDNQPSQGDQPRMA